MKNGMGCDCDGKKKCGKCGAVFTTCDCNYWRQSMGEIIEYPGGICEFCV